MPTISIVILYAHQTIHGQIPFAIGIQASDLLVIFIEVLDGNKIVFCGGTNDISGVQSDCASFEIGSDPQVYESKLSKFNPDGSLAWEQGNLPFGYELEVDSNGLVYLYSWAFEPGGTDRPRLCTRQNLLWSYAARIVIEGGLISRNLLKHAPPLRDFLFSGATGRGCPVRHAATV